MSERSLGAKRRGAARTSGGCVAAFGGAATFGVFREAAVILKLNTQKSRHKSGLLRVCLFSLVRADPYISRIMPAVSFVFILS